MKEKLEKENFLAVDQRNGFEAMMGKHRKSAEEGKSWKIAMFLHETQNGDYRLVVLVGGSGSGRWLMAAEVACPGRRLTLICQGMLLPDAGPVLGQ